MSFPRPETPRFDPPAPPERLFDHDDFTTEDLAAVKGSTSVTVALPARNEADTVGPIVATLKSRLVDDTRLVDELLVIDAASTADTATIARDAGASVVDATNVLPDYGTGGKGEALWKSLHASSGDLIVWCDADIRNFDERFVVGVLGPLLTRPDIGFVKGFYRRPLSDDGEGGGRVTELMARPLIAALFPELATMVQPLSGEFGGRRELLEAVPFHRGYAVDLGLLIDLSRRFGVERIGQVDQGARVHRNRPLRELGPQATAILAMAIGRADPGHAAGPRGPSEQVVAVPVGIEQGERPPAPTEPAVVVLRRPEFGDASIRTGELPPMAAVRAATRSPRQPGVS